jgi:hypothetical protein
MAVAQKHARKEKRGCCPIRFVLKIPHPVSLTYQPTNQSSFFRRGIGTIARGLFFLLPPNEIKRYLNSGAPTFAHVVVIYEKNGHHQGISEFEGLWGFFFCAVGLVCAFEIPSKMLISAVSLEASVRPRCYCPTGG